MKKTILTAAICGAIAISGFAQGTMGFQNSVFSPIKIIVGTSAAANAPSGTLQGSTGSLVVGLFWGTSAGTVLNNLAGTALIGSGTPGVIAGNANLPVATTASGDTDFFEVAAWDNSYGSTLAGMQACIAAGGFWGAANATGYGTFGTPLSFVLGPNPSPGTVMFGSASTTGVYHTFNVISSTPEPGTLALGGLGAAALLLFRRRK